LCAIGVYDGDGNEAHYRSRDTTIPSPSGKARERNEFVDYIAGHPEAGDVIPGTGGIRKVRWGREGLASVAAPG
jgi:hypothetical protein